MNKLLIILKKIQGHPVFQLFQIIVRFFNFGIMVFKIISFKKSFKKTHYEIHKFYVPNADNRSHRKQ